MSRPTGYRGPRYPDPKATAGLHQRLAEKRSEAIGKTTLLPVVNYPHWVKDVKR